MAPVVLVVVVVAVYCLVALQLAWPLESSRQASNTRIKAGNFCWARIERIIGSWGWLLVVVVGATAGLVSDTEGQDRLLVGL